MAEEFGSPPKRDRRSRESVMGSRRVGKVPEALLESQKGSKGPSREPRRFGRARRGRESLPEG